MTHSLLILALGVGAPALKDLPKKDPPIVGRWLCSRLLINGQPSPQHSGLEYEFTVDGRWRIYRDQKEMTEIARTYATDPETSPANLDLCESRDGKSMPGIYRVEGNDLTVSFCLGQGKRPTNLDGGAGEMTLTFTRVKLTD